MTKLNVQHNDIKISHGSASPLGATLTSNGCNFAVRAPNAEQIAVCLYDAFEQEIACFILPSRSGGVWHGHLSNLKAGLLYGYRAKGRNEPEQGLYFDSQKLLIDPYAKAVNRPLNWDPNQYEGDSKDMIPKGCLVEPKAFDWQGAQKPKIPSDETIIYEAHIKGLTKQMKELPLTLRGTYLGLAHPVMIQYLQQIGITTVQLMPINLFMPEPWLVGRGLTNYWGYNPINFFCS